MVFGRMVGRKIGKQWGLHIRKKHREGKEK